MPRKYGGREYLIMTKPTKFFKWVVKLRMWYADIRGHHGKKWNYEPGDHYMGRKKMSNKPLNISEEAAVQMPMKTVASLIIIVALGTMGYFQILERLNIADTRIQIMEKDLEQNTEFRIKWPRGQLGSLPADSEQFMMIEDLYKTTDKFK